MNKAGAITQGKKSVEDSAGSFSGWSSTGIGGMEFHSLSDGSGYFAGAVIVTERSSTIQGQPRRVLTTPNVEMKSDSTTTPYGAMVALDRKLQLLARASW